MKKKATSKITKMKAELLWPTILLGVVAIIGSFFIGSIINWRAGLFFIILEVIVTLAHILTWENDNKLLKNRFVSFLVFVVSMIIGGYVYDAIKIAEEDSMVKFVAYSVMLPILWLWYNRFTVYDE